MVYTTLNPFVARGLARRWGDTIGVGLTLVNLGPTPFPYSQG